MPRPFPAEFRLRAVALVRAGKPITTAAVQLGVSAAALHSWVRQDQIDRGERPGISTPEAAELSKAKKRIRQLETEVEILKIAAKCQAPSLLEARLDPFHRCDNRGGAVLELVLNLDGWPVADLAVEPAVVEPVDVFSRRDLSDR